MKHYLLAIAALLALSASAQQNHWYWFNPFSFEPYNSGSPGVRISFDTSGKAWYAAYDVATGTVHFISEDHSADFTYSNGGSVSTGGSFFIDKQNGFWYSISNGWARFINGVPVALPWPNVPNMYQSAIQGIAMDNSGNFYMYLNIQHFPNADSVYVCKYDGVSFVNYNLTSLFSEDTLSLRGMSCDGVGNLYLTFYEKGLYKLSGTTWTHYPFGDPDATIINVDYANNVYLAGGDTGAWCVRFNGQIFDTLDLPDMQGGSVSEWAIINHPDSSVWFITDGNFFNKMEPGGSWTYVDAPDFCCYWNMGGMYSFYPFFNKDGNIWMTGDNGNHGFVGVYSLAGHTAISGKVFWDDNNNQVADVGEDGVYNVNVLQSTGGYVSNTDVVGNYSVTFLDTSATYNVSVNVPQYYHATTATSYSVNADTDPLCCYDFGLAADGNIQDVEVTVTSYGTPLGYETMRYLSYLNRGTVPVSDTVTYALDAGLALWDAVPYPDVVSGNTLKWAYQNLQPFELRNIAVYCIVDSTLTVGVFLHDTAVAGPLASDTTPSNNVYYLAEEVTAAYDPNEKTVNPVYGVDGGEELTYTVFFQNTGNDTARKVVIRDTLSGRLDASTFRLLGHSHAMSYKLRNAGELEFAFYNIMLPDSHVNEPMSHGFVKYAVKVKSNQLHGTSIPNTASIYFDFNAPVVTNTTNTILGLTAIKEVANRNIEFAVYPNPAAGSFTVELAQTEWIDEMRLYDIAGHVVCQKAIGATSKFAVTTPLTAKGLYFVTVWDNGVCVGRKKLVIE